jgi:hypothetical protein
LHLNHAPSSKTASRLRPQPPSLLASTPPLPPPHTSSPKATSRASAHECSCAVCSWSAFLRMPCTSIYALVARAPCQASSSSCSLNRRTYTPKVSSTRLPKATFHPLLFALCLSPLARAILDAVGNCLFRDFRKRSLDWGQGRNVLCTAGTAAWLQGRGST